MGFGTCNTGNNLSCGYSIDGKVLDFVTSHRDLGVLVDSKLRFHNHIHNVVRKAGGLASELLCSTSCHSSIFMVTLFVSHIRPIMDFCSNVWNVGYLGNIRLLESVQQRLTRQISDVSRLAYVERLKVLELVSIFGQLLRAEIVNYWKIFHSEVDIGLLDGFTVVAIYRRTRGHSFKAVVPRSELEMKCFFHVRVFHRWNSISEHAVTQPALSSFKRKLDKELGYLLYLVLYFFKLFFCQFFASLSVWLCHDRGVSMG